jgi:hypothetical protein
MSGYVPATKCCKSTAMTSPYDSVTSFHFLRLFCFERLFKSDQKWTPYSCSFIFCRRVSMFAVAILPVIACTTWLFTLVFGKVTGDKSSKRFCETWFSTTCYLLLPHQSTCHLSHQSLCETCPWLSLLLHRAFWRFTEYCTPTNAQIVYHILV